ncbi:potassium transporter [Alcaligenaceae bacterium]|nr:potassium transporter [Alcaligenaceae bacterium]
MRPWNPLYTYRSYQRLQRTGVFKSSPPVVLASWFIALILLGTLLLSLPIASHHPIGIFKAFFMATSAVTVTGLTVLEPGTDLTHFGQIVLISLVQLGGLGFVTFAVVSAIALGKKLSLNYQALALEAFNQTSVARIRRTAFSVIKISLIIETIAVIILTLWWWQDYPFLTSLYRAIFHTIAAFNNSGFSLFPSSLSQFVGDPVTVLTITSLIILGGIGFSVLSDVTHKRNWAHLHTYTKVVLLGTLVLNLTGFVLFWAMEFRNPDTLGSLSFHAQGLAAWMQTITSRTAGFTTIDVTKLQDSSTLLMIMLMFIGGGSLSTASGIKIGTFIVLLAAVHSYIFQRKDVVLFKRSIDPSAVQKALALLLVTSGLVFVSLLLMTIMESQPFLTLLFEVVSAISTTGMSLDLTHQLSMPSQILVIFLMFAGRLGPLTLIYSLATQKRSRIGYANTEFQVG